MSRHRDGVGIAAPGSNLVPPTSPSTDSPRSHDRWGGCSRATGLQPWLRNPSRASHGSSPSRTGCPQSRPSSWRRQSPLRSLDPHLHYRQIPDLLEQGKCSAGLCWWATDTTRLTWGVRDLVLGCLCPYVGKFRLPLRQGPGSLRLSCLKPWETIWGPIGYPVGQTNNFQSSSHVGPREPTSPSSQLVRTGAVAISSSPINSTTCQSAARRTLTVKDSGVISSLDRKWHGAGGQSGEESRIGRGSGLHPQTRLARVQVRSLVQLSSAH